MAQGTDGEATKPSRLAPGTLLADRYRVSSNVDDSEVAFVAVDETTQARVTVLDLETAHARALGPAGGLNHAHLARILELQHGTPETGRSTVITEQVTGTTLTEVLQNIGKKTHVDAVRSALRAADALATLHAEGGAHGGVNDRTLIVQPNAHAAPTLVFGPRNADDSPYRRPGDDGPPSEADDSWACAVLLYHMLTGHPPPRAGIESTQELARTELEDEALCEALAHALASDPALRSSDLRRLKRELARWFVDHAGEEVVVVPVSTRSSQPPPLPREATPSSHPPEYAIPRAPPAVTGLGASSPPTPAQGKRTRRVSLLAVGGIALGFAAAWGLSAVRNRPRVEIVEVDPEAAAHAKTAPSAASAGITGAAIELSEVPVTGEAEIATGDKLATCVAGYLPRGAFNRTPDLSRLCGETDPRKGGTLLRAAVMSAAGTSGAATEATKLFQQLGWYDMAAFAVIRSGCCPDAEPIQVSAQTKSCTPVDATLRELGKAVVNGQSYEAPLQSYADAIACEIKAGKAAMFARPNAPQPSEQSAFLEFVKSVQTP